MKRVFLAVMLLATSFTILGCEASGRVGDDDHGPDHHHDASIHVDTN